MIMESDRFGDALIDIEIARDLAPVQCPSEFGPDDRYRLLEIIGVGQSSWVYKAIDTRLSADGFDAVVAVKVLSHDLDERTEAVNARRVLHDHVVRVIDRGRIDDHSGYIVEELVSGGSLADIEVPWEPKKAVAFMVKVARGIQAVHSAGVVHCDLKPANVLLTSDGEPKVADFGMSSLADARLASGGNLAFMSPERFADPVAGLAPPTDIYAVAGLLYYLLTGNAPNGMTRHEIEARLERRPTPPSPHVDPDLDRICRRGLDADPSQRQHSAGAFADDLETWLAKRPLAWAQPSLARRGWLFVCRNTMAVTLMTVLIGAAVALLAAGIHMRMEAQRQEIKSQQLAVDIAEVKLEEVYGRVREHLRRIARALVNPNNPDVAREILPAAVWLDWLTDHPELTDLRRSVVPQERIGLLRKLCDELDERGQQDHLDSFLANLTLCYFQLVEGDEQWIEASTRATATMDRWEGRLQHDDGRWRALVAMRDLAQVHQARVLGADDQVIVDQLRSLESRLAGEGNCESVRQLVISTLYRFENGEFR